MGISIQKNKQREGFNTFREEQLYTFTEEPTPRKTIKKALSGMETTQEIRLDVANNHLWSQMIH